MTELSDAERASLEREKLGHDRRLVKAEQTGDKELAGLLKKRIAAINAALKPTKKSGD